MSKPTLRCIISARRFHTILKWANFCLQDKNYNWTDCDANLVCDIYKEIGRQMKLQYKQTKKKFKR